MVWLQGLADRWSERLHLPLKYPVNTAPSLQSADTQEAGKATGAMSYVSCNVSVSLSSHHTESPSVGIHRCSHPLPTTIVYAAVEYNPRGAAWQVRPEAAVERFAPNGEPGFSSLIACWTESLIIAVHQDCNLLFMA